jgi:hypothetical protein
MSGKGHESETLIVELEDEAYDFANPERALLAAILVNACYDLRKRGLKHRRAREFFLNPDPDYVFSFRSICSYLSIDPSFVLQKVGLQQEANSNSM